MRVYTALVEEDHATGLLVAHVPGFPGLRTQAETIQELRSNLQQQVVEQLQPEAGKKRKAFKLVMHGVKRRPSAEGKGPLRGTSGSYVEPCEGMIESDWEAPQ